MALTKDDKEKILALRAKGYSDARAGKELGFSPTTIRKVRQEAEQQGGDRGSGVHAVAAAPGEAEREAGPAEGVRARFEEFTANQELEGKKGKLGERVGELLATLETLAEESGQSGVSVAGWEERAGKLEQQLADFVLGHVDGVSSEAELMGLVGVVDEIDKGVMGLVEEYQDKVAEQERLRQQRKLENSRRLLIESLGSSFIPAYVRKAMADLLLVRHRSEAEAVFKAAMQWEVVHATWRAEPAKREQVWLAFVRGVEAGGWAFIRDLERRQDILERLLGAPRPPTPYSPLVRLG